jgi:hypothetical protein
MNINAKILNIILIAALVVVVLFFIDKCSKNEELLSQAHAYANYEDTVKYYKGKNNEAIAYNEALEIDKKNLYELNDKMKSKIKALKIKDPTSVTTITTVASIDTLVIKHIDTLPCETFTLPFAIDSTDLYLIDGILTNESIVINNLSIPNEQTIVVGKKKEGLFKPKSFIVTVQNSNPAIQVTGLKNYTIKDRKNILQKPWVHFGMGVASCLLFMRLSSK